MALVTLKAPTASKLFVTMTVQFAIGVVRLVVANTEYLPFAVPPVPLKIRLPPDNLVLVITGCDGPATTFKIPKFNCDRSHAKPTAGAAGTMFAKEPA